MTYVQHNSDLLDALIQSVQTLVGWGGIEFVVFLIAIFVLIVLWRFASR